VRKKGRMEEEDSLTATTTREEIAKFPPLFFPIMAVVSASGASANLAATLSLRRRFGRQAICYFILSLDCAFCGLANTIHALTSATLALTDLRQLCVLIQIVPFTCAFLTFASTLSISASRCRGFQIKPMESKLMVKRQIKNAQRVVAAILALFAAYYVVIFAILKAPYGLAVRICRGGGVEGRAISTFLPLAFIAVMAFATVVLDVAILLRMR